MLPSTGELPRVMTPPVEWTSPQMGAYPLSSTVPSAPRVRTWALRLALSRRYGPTRESKLSIRPPPSTWTASQASTAPVQGVVVPPVVPRSEEHTSELQSRGHLVCRLLL